MDELAAAVGAETAERARAVDAERALERADPGVRRIGRQIAIAAFTTGPELEQVSLLRAYRPTWTYRSRRTPMWWTRWPAVM